MPAVMFLKAPAHLERQIITSAKSRSGHRRADNNTKAVGAASALQLTVSLDFKQNFGVIISLRSPRLCRKKHTIMFVASPLVCVLEHIFLSLPLSSLWMRGRPNSFYPLFRPLIYSQSAVCAFRRGKTSPQLENKRASDKVVSMMLTYDSQGPSKVLHVF